MIQFSYQTVSIVILSICGLYGYQNSTGLSYTLSHPHTHSNMLSGTLWSARSDALVCSRSASTNWKRRVVQFHPFFHCFFASPTSDYFTCLLFYCTIVTAAVCVIWSNTTSIRWHVSATKEGECVGVCVELASAKSETQMNAQIELLRLNIVHIHTISYYIYTVFCYSYKNFK